MGDIDLGSKKYGAVPNGKTASSGAFTITSTPTQVTNLSMTIQATGRPVLITLQSDESNTGAGNEGRIQVNPNFNGHIEIQKNNSYLARYEFGLSGSGVAINRPASIIQFVDFDTTPGSRTYKIVALDSNSTSSSISFVRMVVIEFKL
jgi:hypothetical protein